MADPASISYGPGSSNVAPACAPPGGGSGGGSAATKPYYLTTAINYANGPAHMGHAYEGITADVIARYHRTTKPGAYFLTGSDEHGQKIAGVAEAQGVRPIEVTDRFVKGFQVLNQRQKVAQDDYMRTTSDRHKATCQELWRRCDKQGDIYLDNYEGWYNVREETFVTENDAKLTDYKDAVTGKPLNKVHESSYFFKMSKFQDRLKQHIRDNEAFIQPAHQRNYILKRLEEPLRDLSISRTTFDWGIKVPEGFEPGHVMYVWFDALTNYMSGVNALGTWDADPELPRCWPADCHLIGKDILWFHTVIWPTMLMSAGMPLPAAVFAHGFVNDSEGQKMSKSIGNVIDPHEMLDKYPVDSFRWYLCKEAPFGGELNFRYAPWKMKGDEMDGARKTAVRSTLETIYIATHFLIPFLPDGAAEIFRRLGTPPKCLSDLAQSNLASGQKIEIGSTLFTKIVSDEERTAEEAKAAKAKELAASQAKKKAAKAENAKKAAAGSAASGGDADQPEFTKMDIRVGKITKVSNHPEADKLYVEEVDVGGNETRVIVSGLREHYTLEEMQGRLVCVVCNLKKSKLVGVDSCGMVLACKGESKTELVDPPEGSEVGARVFIDGLSGEPFSDTQVKKKKTWQAVSADLKTDATGQATWKGGVIKTEKGVVKAATLGDVAIS
ncbi:hypothetical protein TeGR_g288 [Tetraparma gracilis]|uniref:methionine--tRNA ligase n=1 Tax=Tetraparma gracilis TaxID=2962635 RepID=A0ABQ6MDY2_9STRA|nr:hypothetical protein TeGR_g288 [Tetraparma gracilis]